MGKTATAGAENRFETGEQITPAMIAGLAEEAAERLDGFVSETPVFESEALSVGATQVFVKDETAHPGKSFKDRGAGNAVLYHADEGEEFVITASAGNHGRGLARAAAEQGMDAAVVVAHSVNDEKRSAISRTGAELITHGQNFDDALNHGLAVAKEQGGRFVHPFADPLVIAGQGTIGLELLRQSPDMTHLVLPVGGGGMLAGVASVIKEHKENVKIVAAQIEGNTAYVDSLRSGRPLQNQPLDRRFEGIAVGNVHPMTFDIAKHLVDRTVVLDTAELYKTLYDYRKEHGTLLEVAGAVSPTAANHLARTAWRGAGATVVTVASGANPPNILSRWLDARARRYGWDEDNSGRY